MDTVEEIDFTDRVQRGVALLDEWNIIWPSMVDLKILDVSDPWVCILAQTAGRYPVDELRSRYLHPHKGSYGGGLKVLKVAPEMSHIYGFHIAAWEITAPKDPDDCVGLFARMYARLTDTWREAINARLSAVQTSA